MLGRCSHRRLASRLFPALVCALLACSTPEQNLALGATAAAVLGGMSPAQEIEQTYYLGVYDPQGQIPPAVYRLRVHGQSSLIGRMRFNSGWVPAALVDTLGSDFAYLQDGTLELKQQKDGIEARLSTGRRLVMFGPEGFREAPADHRLVIVMGSSPEDFFKGVDQAMGALASAADKSRDEALDRDLFETLVQLRAEEDRLRDLERSGELALGEEVLR